MKPKTKRKRSDAASLAGKLLAGLGAKKGGEARIAQLDAAGRKELARRAATARWKKERAK